VNILVACKEKMAAPPPNVAYSPILPASSGQVMEHSKYKELYVKNCFVKNTKKYELRYS